MMKSLKRDHGNSGFTLIELLVVIAIIGILSSVVLASLNSARQKGRDARRVSDIKQLQLALELYYDANGRYPTTTTALVAPGYIASVPVDPSTAVAYVYAGLGSGATCTSYHLGAELEAEDHAGLDGDNDAADGTECTNGGTDFDGGGATCADGATGNELCFDVKP